MCVLYVCRRMALSVYCMYVGGCSVCVLYVCGGGMALCVYCMCVGG